MRVAAGQGVAFVGLAIGCVLALLLVWRWGQRRLRAAEQAERSANERRDRFVASVAAELDAPLAAGRVDEARRILAELAHTRALQPPSEAVDIGELVREILAAPPFSDRAPAVTLRAAPVKV